MTHQWITQWNQVHPSAEVTKNHIKAYSTSKTITDLMQETGLIDGGANGIIAGEECVWIGGPSIPRTVDVTGIDKHQLTNISIGTVGSLCITNRGPVIVIFNEVAYTGKHNTILSRLQLEAYHNSVNDRPVQLGGSQKIIPPDGYTFPLSIINGLPYLHMRRYSQQEYDTLPHIIMTSDQGWDPRAFDSYIDPFDHTFYASNPKDLHLLPCDDYNVIGEYIGTQATSKHQVYQLPQTTYAHLL